MNILRETESLPRPNIDEAPYPEPHHQPGINFELVPSALFLDVQSCCPFD